MDFDWHAFVYPCKPLSESVEKSSCEASVDVAKSTFDMGFDEFFEKMNCMKSMFMELDGSFVWRGGEGDNAWQVDGVASERNERVAFLEVKGAGSRTEFKQILELLDWPEQSVRFELPRQGTRCTAEQFFA